MDSRHMKMLLLVCVTIVLTEVLCVLVSNAETYTGFVSPLLSALSQLSDSLHLRNVLYRGNTSTSTAAIGPSGMPMTFPVVPGVSRMTSTPEDHSSPPFCAPNPPNLVGSLVPDLVARSWEELLQLFPQVQHGGQYKPPDCRSRDRVAVVVPYRDRELHLRVLLHSLHPILQRQQLQYRIIISEPELPTTFNRGLAMNVGFREALKLDNFTCFIFHDVDLYPENDRIPYTCSNSPAHLSVAMDKFHYNLPYLSYFGGVSALSREHYEKINGFSNVFFGWGGEDDDLYSRVISAGMKISRPPIAVGRYRMYRHSRDKTNPQNPMASRMLGTSSRRMSWDGLSNLNASIVKVEEHPLYTHVLFRADKDTLLKEFEQREHGGR